jgi:hypothetical protein
MEHMRWNQSIQNIINAHSCDGCRRIEFRITEPISHVPLSFPYQKVLNYAGDGCDFFDRALRKLDLQDGGSPLAKDLELCMSLIWIDEGPKFHCVHIEWMHGRTLLHEENEADELHAFASEGIPSPPSYIL